MFKLSSNLSSAKSRLIILLAIVSMVLVACDMASAPEDEQSLIEGPPEVTIASPLAGDTYNAGVGVNILLRVDNAGEDVARIAIEVDGQIIGEAILPNPNGDASFTVSNGWPAEGEGQHVISAVASRSDGTVSEEASVTINVVVSTTDDTDDEDMSDDDADAQTVDNTPIPSPTTDTSQNTSSVPATTASTATTAPTNTPAATNTPSRPQVRITTGANVRPGPGVVFDPPMGSLAAGATSNIVAVNPAGTWYKIEYYNGEGWVSSVVAEVIGDISGLPREAGPPTPVPATATPLPSETPIPSNVDLIIDAANSSFVPSFVCNQASQISITVVNQGSGTSTGTNVLIEDVQPNGQVGATTQTAVGALGPNQSQVVTAALTVSTFISEGHTFRARVDGNNSVAESNETNNTWSEVYVLEAGSC